MTYLPILAFALAATLACWNSYLLLYKRQQIFQMLLRRSLGVGIGIFIVWISFPQIQTLSNHLMTHEPSAAERNVCYDLVLSKFELWGLERAAGLNGTRPNQDSLVDYCNEIKFSDRICRHQTGIVSSPYKDAYQ